MVRSLRGTAVSIMEQVRAGPGLQIQELALRCEVLLTDQGMQLRCGDRTKNVYVTPCGRLPTRITGPTASLRRVVGTKRPV